MSAGLCCIRSGIYAEMLEIHGVEVANNGVGDSLIQPELLIRLPTDEPIATATLAGA